jgi:hypothetical protein
MKRIILIIFIISAISASAQNAITKAFSAGVELGIPSNSIYTIGLGVSAKGELPVSDKVAITITAGYSTFFYKSNLFQSSLTPANAAFVPLKAGLKYYFNNGVYLEGEAGTAIETNYLKQDLFAFSIGPGFIIQTNNGHGIDLGFRYEGWSNNHLRQTAIRAAYRF